MKKLLFICCILISITKIDAQNVGINGTAATPDPSAMLDIAAANKGLLIPRVSLTSTVDVATIPSPLTSLLVYNTNTAMTGGGVGYYYYDGAVWQLISGGGKEMIWYTGFNTNATINSLASAQTFYLNNPFVAFSAINEAISQIKMPKCLFTRLRIYINNNTLNGTSIYTIRKNGVSQALTLTINAASIGFFEATGSVSFADGDLLSIQGINAGSAGGIGILRVELSYY